MTPYQEYVLKKVVKQSNTDILTIEGDDLIIEKMGSYVEDQTFGKVFKSFEELWPEDPKERRRVELLKPSFSRKGKQLFYKGKLCLPQKAAADVTELAHDRWLAGYFGFAKTIGRL